MDILYKHLHEVVDATWNYAGRLKTDRDHMLNAVLGLAGESGEVADHHKKLFYHIPKDEKETREKLRLELGDVIYYWLKVVDLHNFTIGELLEANRNKLFKRHGIKDA
jgi:NTP pyrophosphatase (non-canonical NTP hydrolase)